MTKAHWHYPRTAFAKSLLLSLVDGPLQGVSLFGPRRTGKTQFLMQDLAPVAHAAGHSVVYVNFWQALDSPLASLLYEFDFALRHGTWLDRAQHVAADLAPKFKIRDLIGDGEMEVDLAHLKGRAPDNLLLLIDQYCHRLANNKKPTLLLFDEFQELARGNAAKPLIAALRTSLDKRKHGIVTVFTGSSQERLQTMFSPTQAPFYRFATQIDLPPLSEDFVDHQVDAFLKTFKTKLDKVEAYAIFAQCERNPLFFQRWLMARGLHTELNAELALAKVNADLAAEFGFAEKWRQLSPIQRAVARALAERVRGVFGESGGARIAALLGEPPPAPQQTQTAIKRLTRLGHVDKWDKDWRLTDPLFEAWIRARPEAEF